MKRNYLCGIFAAGCIILSPGFSNADNIKWYDGTKPVSVGFDTKKDLVVETAMEMFASDMKEVTGQAATISKSDKSIIRVAQLNKASKTIRKSLERIGVPISQLDTLTDGFNITVADGRIYVTGTNGRGAAYGLLELSREAGVSPWIWWGDVKPQRKETLELPDEYNETQGASVEFRGIFLNDEDWSLRPWSYGNYEPNEFGTIGPKTNKEIFKLMMRLRANAIWPAMHTGTTAFFKDPQNKLVADSCGIAVGTSHCEPLLRNNVDEWDVSERGAFNYITNKQAVQDYWIERLDEVKNSSGGNMFTIGMRGIHDGSMEGVKTNEEKFNALQQVINDQQTIIRDHIGDPSKQMQVFVPYKEVLELYEMGLEVPEYVTLMWCDDNYGYITRLSNEDEQKRTGGGGIYYHLSYWGRPHDYLWLTTTQPGLIYNEMRNAYDHNVRKLWIANVHDPKVAAYDIELFLDMAWDINSVRSDKVGEHLRSWLKTNLGETVGEKLYPQMRKFYELCGKRRPEFMGWNQVEVDKKYYNRGLSPVVNTEFSFTEFGGEADRFMEEFVEISENVANIGKEVSPELADAYFAAIEYPVACAANNAVKMLEAQRARSYANGSTKGDMFVNNEKIYTSVAKSQNAYQNIRKLTDKYNNEMSGGKWKHSMNMRPRDLPDGAAPLVPTSLTDMEAVEYLNKSESTARHALNADGVIAGNADGFAASNGGVRVIDMLGHGSRSVELDKGSSVSYEFEVTEEMKNPVVTTAMIPTQPNDNGRVRYRVSVDGLESVEFDLKEPFRSERWKQNVLRGQALRTHELPALSPGKHTLTITALDSHIVLDQWSIDPKKNRNHYLIPVAEIENGIDAQFEDVVRHLMEKNKKK
ncbi:MAG: glycosyl hydrolase 115 family protein [Muribaculum sp.]|nr:glycosyl hydrolase 115 family protein [Muribaculum sp.]